MRSEQYRIAVIDRSSRMVNKTRLADAPRTALPSEQRLALAYTPTEHRPMLAALFGLDAKLSHFVARGGEPVLVQLRLAWWRDQLGKSSISESSRDPLLTALQTTWAGDEANLVRLVDAWEARIDEADGAACDDLVGERGTLIAAFARRVGATEEASRAETAGRLWAIADLRLSESLPDCDRLPKARALRGVCVLGGLARRSISRGAPMLSDRSSAVVAFRLATFGR